jgi:tRNA (cytidine32/uridine32-2'-O)-methyltransferase
MSLSNIRIVLVEPRHPGNVGAVARAMKTMAIENLYLVRPDRFPSEEATKRAVSAVDVLNRAVVTEDLQSAILDCKLVIGGSGRSREFPLPALEAREGGLRVVQEAAAGHLVAVLFGEERNGLTNQSLDACSYQLRIPTNPEFASLNLASAVQLVCYEIFMAAEQAAVRSQDPVQGPVEAERSSYPSHEELEFFYQHLERTLEERDFAGSMNPDRVYSKLRRLIARARPRDNELRLLHSLVRLMQWESWRQR